MGKNLWESDDVGLWCQALDSYPAALEAKHKNLPGLDRWWREELGPLISSRGPPHLTKEELVKLVEWKMVRGKSRPVMLKNVGAQNSEGQVTGTSEEALAHVLSPQGKPLQTWGGQQALTQAQEDAVKAAIDDMALNRACKLKYVGPATASAILAAAVPGAAIPFMSDEALSAVFPGQANFRYDISEYLKLLTLLHQKAMQLNTLQKEQKEVQECARMAQDVVWTAGLVEQALFAAEHGPGPAEPAGDEPKTTRRKGEDAAGKTSAETKPAKRSKRN